jgi:hypothetical protein
MADVVVLATVVAAVAQRDKRLTARSAKLDFSRAAAQDSPWAPGLSRAVSSDDQYLGKGLIRHLLHPFGWGYSPGA